MKSKPAVRGGGVVAVKRRGKNELRRFSVTGGTKRRCKSATGAISLSEGKEGDKKKS